MQKSILCLQKNRIIIGACLPIYRLKEFSFMAQRILSALRSYLRPGYVRRRLLMTIVGVCVTGIAAGLIKRAAFGVDPYQCLCNGIHNVFPIAYGTLYMIINFVTLLVVLVLNRRYIGLGTLINMFLLGYIIDGTEQLLIFLAPAPSVGLRVFYLIAGFVIVCFAASMYFAANMGVSTYDAIALHLAAKKVGPFRIIRIITDFLCVFTGFVLGWMPGIGTIAFAIGTGPLISFFNDHFSTPLLNGTLGRKVKTA